MLVTLVPRNTPAIERALPTLVAADPIGGGKGVTRPAAKVLGAIIDKARADRSGRYRQAHPEVVAEVLAERPDLRVPEVEPLLPIALGWMLGEEPRGLYGPGDERPIQARQRG